MPQNSHQCLCGTGEVWLKRRCCLCLGWGVDDELRLYFLGAELHPLWLLEDCGVQDLCQLRISRRRAAVHSHPVDL